MFPKRGGLLALCVSEKAFFNQGWGLTPSRHVKPANNIFRAATHAASQCSISSIKTLKSNLLYTLQSIQSTWIISQEPKPSLCLDLTSWIAFSFFFFTFVFVAAWLTHQWFDIFVLKSKEPYLVLDSLLTKERWTVKLSAPYAYVCLYGTHLFTLDLDLIRTFS